MGSSDFPVCAGEDDMSFQIQSTNIAGNISPELQKKNGLAVKIKADQKSGDPDLVKNPKGQDKIELSNASLKEELALVKSQEQQREAGKKVLDDLHNRLLQMESILHQVAATISFDADSLREIQKHIKSELRGTKEILKKVELPGITKLNLEDIGLESSPAKVESREDLENTGKMFGDAAAAVEKIREQAAATENELRTGKALEVAHQNTEAALSTYNPREIFAQADNVAQRLREQGGQALKVHSAISYRNVINLIG
jgi:hypothetical protein